MMILSLNAPAVQAIPESRKPTTSRAAPTIFWPKRSPSARGGFRPSPRCRCRTPSLRRANWIAASRSSVSAARSSTASRRPATPETCRLLRSAAISGRSGTVVEKLDVPFYLHPRNPLAAWAQIYEGHRWLLGPTWAFGQETAVHALRLMGSGLFDAVSAPEDRPRPHGRGSAVQHVAHRQSQRLGRRPRRDTRRRRKIADYFHENF